MCRLCFRKSILDLRKAYVLFTGGKIVHELSGTNEMLASLFHHKLSFVKVASVQRFIIAQDNDST